MSKTYYEAHRKECNARTAAYYVEHREEMRSKQRAYHMSHLEEKRAYRRVYNETHREALRAKGRTAQAALDTHKTSLGCSSCGYVRCAAALDFHHKDPVGKERRINANQWVSQTPTIVAEIKKCILLCANCHREAHQGARRALELEK